MKKKSQSEPELVTGSELARRFNVSEAAVRKAVSIGRIIPAFIDAKGRKYFDESAARTQWNKNTHPEKPTGKSRVKPAVGKEPDLQDLGAVDVRKLRESRQARLLEFRILEKEGSLVEAHAVRIAWETQVTKAKQLFLALPMDLRMHIPGLTIDDVSLIERRIHDILEELSVLSVKEITDVGRS